MIDFVPVLLAAPVAFIVSVAVWVFERKKLGKFSPWWRGEGYQIFLLATILMGAVLYRIL